MNSNVPQGSSRPQGHFGLLTRAAQKRARMFAATFSTLLEVARRIESHRIPGPAGALEALLEEPDDREPVLGAVVCHPHPLYGGTMHNKVVHRMARGLRRAGAVVLRFNFRGVGTSEGEHAHVVGEVEDARAALAWLRARHPALPFALAGFSFGARVITQLGCAFEGLEWMLAAGFPTSYGEHGYLESCAARKIFIQSTRDQYGPRGEMEALLARLPEPKKLIWIEAADHFFGGALDELEGAVMKCGEKWRDRPPPGGLAQSL